MLEASALELPTVAIHIINSVDKTNIILLYSPTDAAPHGFFKNLSSYTNSINISLDMSGEERIE